MAATSEIVFDIKEFAVHDGPKVGNNDDRIDSLITWLFDTFADACEGYGRTSRGGILRPGTGYAMYYLWLAQGGHPGMREPVVGATAEGRKKGSPWGQTWPPSRECASAGR